MQDGLIDLNTILNVVALIVILAGGFAFFKTKLSDSTIKNYQESITSLNTRLDTLSQDLTDALLEQKLMAEEIRVLKTVPLGDIMAGIKSILETQTKILQHIDKLPASTTINNNK